MRARRPAATLVVVLLGLALMAVALGTFDFMLEAMRVDLGMTTGDAGVALVLPEIGCLLVVFIAGMLGGALGPRRVIAGGALVFAAGGLLVAGTPSLAGLVVGRALEGVGGTFTAIVALALLSDAFPSGRSRALAFGASAAVVPAVWVVAPFVGAWVTMAGSWRIAALMWAAAGIVTALAAYALMPRDPSPRRAELLTPLLGGVVLAGLVTSVTSVGLGGQPLLIGGLIASVAGLVALVPAMRRVRAPGLDLRLPFSRPGALALAAILVANIVNLLFFTSLLLQYRYDADPLEIALLLLPMQLAGTAGGLAGGPVTARVGVVRAGTLLLALGAATSLLALLIDPTSAPWLPVVTICVFAAVDAATTGPLTQRLMDLAPAGSDGAASAHREASASIGAAVGAVIATVIVFASFQANLQGELVARGVPPEQASQVARQVADGGGAAEVAGTISSPPSGIRELMGPDPLPLGTAQVATYHDAAILSAITYGAAAVLFLASGGMRVRRGRWRARRPGA